MKTRSISAAKRNRTGLVQRIAEADSRFRKNLKSGYPRHMKLVPCSLPYCFVFAAMDDDPHDKPKGRLASECASWQPDSFRTSASPARIMVSVLRNSLHNRLA